MDGFIEKAKNARKKMNAALGLREIPPEEFIEDAKKTALPAILGVNTLLNPLSAHAEKKSAPVQITKMQQSSDARFESQRLEQMISEIQKAPVESFGPEFFSKEDIACLADNTYYEAQGEIKEGWSAVIFATLSRVLDKNFPNSICGVVHQPWQFSWTTDKKLQSKPKDQAVYDKITAKIKDLAGGRTIEEAAILSGMEAGLPHGAVFYKRKGFEGSPAVQRFFGSLESVGVIGHHEFFVRKAD